MIQKYILAALVLAMPVAAWAQAGSGQNSGSRIELLRADVLKYDKSLGIEAQRLIGDVRFRHAGALMYCDSAYLYNASNSLDAFGNVRVVQGDTLTLTGEKLFYDGNTKKVKVRDNVTLQDVDMTLKTHTLDYDRNTALAVFYDRGIIRSKVNENELIACEGIYASDTEMFYFRDSVVLNNPDYRVETDTLNYSNLSEIAWFFGPTFIFSDENTIYCENGWYNTKTDVSQFEENAYLDNGKQVLRGDSLWYDRTQGFGKAFENVRIIDTAGHYFILGDYGQYLAEKQQSLVTGRAEMVQYDGRDSLFLHADTLMAIRDERQGDRVLAFYGVRFFGTELQGAADSLIYTENDSLIRMFTRPILWSQALQITGDTIEIKAFGGTVDELYVHDNAFMADRADPGKFNQIKGRSLTGYFRDNELYKAVVQGNAESFYYAAEEPAEDPGPTEIPVGNETSPAAADSIAMEDSPVLADSTAQEADFSSDSTAVAHAAADTTAPPPANVKFIGVNKAACSSIVIHLQDRKVHRIVFLTQPDGTFLPLDMLAAEDAFLKGFLWEDSRRPKTRADIFKAPAEPVENP